jgi:hypothetical protein
MAVAGTATGRLVAGQLDLDAHKHTGAQQFVRIGQRGLHRDVARGGIDLGIDRGHRGFKLLVGEGVHRDGDLAAQRERGQLALRHVEIDEDRIELLQRQQGCPAGDKLSDIDLPDAHAAGERCAHMLLGDLGP